MSMVDKLYLTNSFVALTERN